MPKTTSVIDNSNIDKVNGEMESRFHGNDQKEFGALDYITDNEGVPKEHYQLVASDEGINLNIHRIKKRQSG